VTLLEREESEEYADLTRRIVGLLRRERRRRRASLQPPRSTSSEIAKPRGLAVFVHRRLHIVLQNVRVIDPSFPDDITRVGPNEAVIVCMFPVTLGSTPTC
jgi:hypothetical protein